MPSSSNHRVTQLREARAIKHWRRASLILSPSAVDALKHLLAAGYADNQTDAIRLAIAAAPVNDAIEEGVDVNADRLSVLTTLLAGYPTHASFCQVTGIRTDALSRALKTGHIGEAMAKRISKANHLPKDGQEAGGLKKGRAQARKVIDIGLSATIHRKLNALCRQAPAKTREEVVSQLLITASDAVGPVKTSVADQRLRAFRQLLKRYKTQQDLAAALQIYPERLTRILAGQSNIGRVLAKRIAALAGE